MTKNTQHIRVIWSSTIVELAKIGVRTHLKFVEYFVSFSTRFFHLVFRSVIID